MPVKIVIENATIVTMDQDRRVLPRGAVIIENDRIAAIQDMDTYRAKTRDHPDVYRDYQVYDASGKTVFPGFINTHTHLFQGLLKGLGDDRVLVDWFKQVTGPSAAELTPDDCRAAADLGMLEALASGTTCVFDFMYPHNSHELSEPIIQAMGESGLRGVFGRGYIDTGREAGVPHAIIEDHQDALQDVERLFDKYQDAYDGRLKIWIAPCMIWTLTRAGLAATGELSRAKNIPLSMHIAETPFELENARSRFGMKDLELCAYLGLLEQEFLAVHCVHLDQRDLRMLKDYDVKVSYNPVSNMYLASGTPPVDQMLLAGITVGLASDGPASNNNQNMIETMKFGALLPKVAAGDPTVVTAEKILEMATIDAARTLGLDHEIGSLTPGKKADLAILDFAATSHAAPWHHPVSTLVYAATGQEVESVMVNGAFCLKDGRFVNQNADKILETARERAEALSHRAGTRKFQHRPWRTTAY